MVIGPAIGCVLSGISLDAPVCTTALIAVLVGLVAVFVLPGSLAPHHGSEWLGLGERHPFKALRDAFAREGLRVVSAGFALIGVPFCFYVDNLCVLGEDGVGWGPALSRRTPTPGRGCLVVHLWSGCRDVALDGLMSNAVGADEQGRRLAGGISSVGSAIQMAAPLLAGRLHASTGPRHPVHPRLPPDRCCRCAAAVLLFRARAGVARQPVASA
nr:MULTISPECIES: hypothetical protein [Streptomyces]